MNDFLIVMICLTGASIGWLIGERMGSWFTKTAWEDRLKDERLALKAVLAAVCKSACYWEQRAADAERKLEVLKTSAEARGFTRQ